MYTRILVPPSTDLRAPRAPTTWSSRRPCSWRRPGAPI